MTNGYVLSVDQLEGRGDLPDLRPIGIITEENAQFQGFTIEEEAKRMIAWEVKTCGRDPNHLYLFPIGDPVRFNVEKEIIVQEQSKLTVNFKEK